MPHKSPDLPEPLLLWYHQLRYIVIERGSADGKDEGFYVKHGIISIRLSILNGGGLDISNLF